MIQNEIAQKYSLALFELGKDEEKLLSFKDELLRVKGVINKYGDLKRFLLHPRILPENKKLLINDIFGGELSRTIFNFLNLLVDRRRENYLEIIIEEFIQMVNKEEKILEVEVVSAIKLSEELKESLKVKLNQILDNRVIIYEKIDPAIIGGLILKIGDHIIDGSIKNNLASLKEKIAQISVSELGV